MNSARDEMPLFAKTYAFLKWLVPLTNHFALMDSDKATRILLEQLRFYAFKVC